MLRVSVNVYRADNLRLGRGGEFIKSNDWANDER